jgi:hypothetical protein
LIENPKEARFQSKDEKGVQIMTGTRRLSFAEKPCAAVATRARTAMAHTLKFSPLSGSKSFETATIALLEPMGATILATVPFQKVPRPDFAVDAEIVLAGVFFVGKGKN